MSETLLAVLLVTSSAKGSSLVYRWPPHPATRPRLARPLPTHDATCVHADNPWRAAHASQPSNPCNEYGQHELDIHEHDELLGYSAEFLASLLCPHSAMCHQKFELVVDELAFIGHPVCAEEDGGWRF
ncbi:uncharacterized protein PHACADRAFT_58087, partial [Phanerochaete carnosa HHB-10118-sp]